MSQPLFLNTKVIIMIYKVSISNTEASNLLKFLFLTKLNFYVSIIKDKNMILFVVYYLN